MKEKYRLFVFDWEGTLGDTLGQIVRILPEEAQKLNLKPPELNDLRKVMTYGLNKAVEKLFPEIDRETSQKLLQAIQQAYIIKPQEDYLIPGAEEFVKMLKSRNLNVAIATNRSKDSLQRALKNTELNNYFSVTRSSDQCPPKPSPVMINEIIDIFQIDKPEVLMIGDSVADIQMAKSASVDAIGINFYNHPYITEDLLNAGALTVVTDYNELAQYLKLS